MNEFSDISYVASGLKERDTFREFDLYLPTVNQLGPHLLVFVHGGAWRSEDKADHAHLARRLAKSTQIPVAVPNYTLTPSDPLEQHSFCHPRHAEDILDALLFLHTWDGPPGLGRVYNAHSFYLIGHSCSAHMLSSIFLDSSSITPSITPPLSLASAVKVIIMSEGIYDIDLLLDTFPDYKQWFIAPTFGSRASYAPFSVTNLLLVHRHIRWLLIHSTADTLVDLQQSQIMHKHLSDLYALQTDKVVSNFHELSTGHNEILYTDEYIHIISSFVAR